MPNTINPKVLKQRYEEQFTCCPLTTSQIQHLWSATAVNRNRGANTPRKHLESRANLTLVFMRSLSNFKRTLES